VVLRSIIVLIVATLSVVKRIAGVLGIEGLKMLNLTSLTDNKKYIQNRYLASSLRDSNLDGLWHIFCVLLEK
jgi:hypothetical protein